jgi:hypothetical protein
MPPESGTRGSEQVLARVTDLQPDSIIQAPIITNRWRRHVLPKLWYTSTTLTNSVAPEPEGSSPHSQQPVNDPYPEPGESTPHPPPNQSP